MIDKIVSVMIPTWNPNPVYLKEALDSVLMQDWGPTQMQIGIVDDCSTQIDVKKLLNEWNLDVRVEYYQNETNRGIGGNWNSCIEKSKGEWIHILHQDDCVLEGFYKATIHHASADKIEFSFCRTQFINPDGVQRSFTKQKIDDQTFFSLSEYFNKLEIVPSSWLIKKNVFNLIGLFDERLVYNLDREFLFRYLIKSPVFFHNKVFHQFRIHEHSQSLKLGKTGFHLLDRLKAIELINQYVPSEFESIVLNARSQLNQQILNFLVRSNDVSQEIKVKLLKQLNFKNRVKYSIYGNGLFKALIKS